MNGMKANDACLQNGSDGHSNGHSSSSSQPIPTPGTNNGNKRHDNLSDEDYLLLSTSFLPNSDKYRESWPDEDTPFLTIPSSFPRRLSSRPKAPSSPWGANSYFGYSSPMSSRSRNLRLPDFDLREARRRAAAAANARMTSSRSDDFGSKQKLGRDRSSSLGDDKDQTLEDNSRHSILLGEELLKRRTPSGLSLMDLTSEVVMAIDIENFDDDHEGYGAATQSVYTEPLREAGNTTPIRTSQSCSTPDMNSYHPPPTPPTGTKKDNCEKTLVEELKEEFESQSNPPLLSILYGIVNVFIILPVIMSFGSIIYHDEFFRPYMPALMKLTVVSGVVHQITFSTFSTLPFAVGQVQDAGLIFLSAMATDVVSRLKAQGVDDTSILATVTIGLSVYTAVLGCALVLIGKFQLASYCQLLPSCVVGGYLAFIGFFCGQAGLALMASVDVTGLTQWYKFVDSDALTLLAPGVVGGCTVYFSVRMFRHMAVLPSCIIMLMVLFYAILGYTGTSVQEATEYGWITKTVDSPSWTHTWDFLKIEKVVWSVLPTQTLTVLAMISVVTLSSSLDIAAIEIELKRPLDYNHELKTVGLSNIISGITGGYTGSYIFSQTIFSLRMGIRSRLMGFVLALISLVSVVIPVNILSFIPNFFFGSLLVMICLDLMIEWLIDVRSQVTSAEYVIVLSSFAMLLMFGVLFGMIAGTVLYLIMQRMGYDVGKDKKLNDYEMPMQNECR